MRILTKRQVDINQKDVLQRTPLHYCCIGGKEQLARHLIDGFEMLDVHIRDCYGYNPLMYAAMRGQPSIVLLLTNHYVSSSTSVDDRDTRGRTALMLACACGNYVSAYILLTVGKAGKNRRDDVFFRSPAEWVEEAEAIREEEVRRENDPLVRLTVPLNAVIDYDRRMTRLLRLPKMTAMYDRAKPFICEHPRKASWHYPECFSELVKGIPEMFTHFHMPPTREAEQFIDGEDSCTVLLAALEDPAPPVKPCKPDELSPVNNSTISADVSHASLAGVGTSNTRITTQTATPARCVSTPRLIELRQNQDRMMVPDLVTLFGMYVPRDVTEKRALPRQDVPQDQRPTQQSHAMPLLSNMPKVVHLSQYH